MKIDGDKVWMTAGELESFREQQLQTAWRTNRLLAELCLLLLKEMKEYETKDSIPSQV